MTEVVTPAMAWAVMMTIPPDALVPSNIDTEVWKDTVATGLKERSSYGTLAT